VHEHGAVIQGSKPIESPQLLPRLLVNSFAGVHNERPTNGSGGARVAKVAPESQRMAPAVFLDHTHGEIFPLQFRPKMIVVTDCGYSAQKVS
jgi:hypothetical protein